MRALGHYSYVISVPTVTGEPNLVKLLAHDCKNVTRGVLNVDDDAIKAVEAILTHIEEKRGIVGFSRRGIVVGARARLRVLVQSD